MLQILLGCDTYLRLQKKNLANKSQRPFKKNLAKSLNVGLQASGYTYRNSTFQGCQHNLSS